MEKGGVGGKLVRIATGVDDSSIAVYLLLLANTSSGFIRDNDSSSFVLIVGSQSVYLSPSKFNESYDGYAPLKVAHERQRRSGGCVPKGTRGEK